MPEVFVFGDAEPADETFERPADDDNDDD